MTNGYARAIPHGEHAFDSQALSLTRIRGCPWNGAWAWVSVAMPPREKIPVEVWHSPEPLFEPKLVQISSKRVSELLALQDHRE